jgi:HicB family
MAMYTLLFGHAEWPAQNEAPARYDAADLPQPDRIERLSLRVPSVLKNRVEASAALEGVSPNAWVERALSRSVDPRLLSS